MSFVKKGAADSSGSFKGSLGPASWKRVGKRVEADNFSQTFIKRAKGNHQPVARNVSDAFTEQCKEIRTLCNRYERSHRFIVSDGGTVKEQRYLRLLDFFRSLCVLILTVVSPIEITMRAEFEFNFWVGFGLGCNLLFFCDMIITFNRAYRAPRSQGGKYIFSRKAITRRYLRGWFVVDLVSTIPYDLPLIFMSADRIRHLSYTIRIVSVLKLVRGLKLIPVFRAIIIFITLKLRVTYAIAEVRRQSLTRRASHAQGTATLLRCPPTQCTR